MPSVFASAGAPGATFGAVLFWMAVVACAVAQVAILRSVLVARAPEQASFPGLADQPLPTVRASTSRPVEIFWAVLPAVALVAVLALTWRAMHPAAAAAPARTAAAPAAEV